MKTYFDDPTQVVFYDLDNTDECSKPLRIGGIAYADKIICGCCGGTIDIVDYLADFEYAMENCETAVYEPLEELSWVDISEAIVGE